jgi:hypothetical protein
MDQDYAKSPPEYWMDDNGNYWKVPTIIGRLKMKCPGHRALREFVIRRDGSCRWCNTTEDLIADHIVSRRNGGSHHPSNLQALCQSCNSRKSGLVDSKRGAA